MDIGNEKKDCFANKLIYNTCAFNLLLKLYVRLLFCGIHDTRKKKILKYFFKVFHIQHSSVRSVAGFIKLKKYFRFLYVT